MKEEKKMEERIKEIFSSMGWEYIYGGIDRPDGYYHPDYPEICLYFWEKKKDIFVAISNSCWTTWGGGKIPIPMKIVRIRENAKVEGVIEYLLPFAAIEDWGGEDRE